MRLGAARLCGLIEELFCFFLVLLGSLAFGIHRGCTDHAVDLFRFRALRVFGESGFGILFDTFLPGAEREVARGVFCGDGLVDPLLALLLVAQLFVAGEKP